jgi:hypothetical protein
LSPSRQAIATVSAVSYGALSAVPPKSLFGARPWNDAGPPILLTAPVVAHPALDSEPAGTNQALLAYRPGMPLLARRDTAARKPPLPDGFVMQQTFAGFVGGAKGMLIGTLVGLGVVASNPKAFAKDWDAIGPLLAGSLVGYLVGVPIAVNRFSNSKGVHAPFLASLGGATVGIVGMVGGPVGFFTIPFGAAVGHDAARRVDPPPVAKP